MSPDKIERLDRDVELQVAKLLEQKRKLIELKKQVARINSFNELERNGPSISQSLQDTERAIREALRVLVAHREALIEDKLAAEEKHAYRGANELFQKVFGFQPKKRESEVKTKSRMLELNSMIDYISRRMVKGVMEPSLDEGTPEDNIAMNAIREDLAKKERQFVKMHMEELVKSDSSVALLANFLTDESSFRMLASLVDEPFKSRAVIEQLKDNLYIQANNFLKVLRGEVGDQVISAFEVNHRKLVEKIERHEQSGLRRDLEAIDAKIDLLERIKTKASEDLDLRVMATETVPGLIAKLEREKAYLMSNFLQIKQFLQEKMPADALRTFVAKLPEIKLDAFVKEAGRKRPSEAAGMIDVMLATIREKLPDVPRQDELLADIRQIITEKVDVARKAVVSKLRKAVTDSAPPVKTVNPLYGKKVAPKIEKTTNPLFVPKITNPLELKKIHDVQSIFDKYLQGRFKSYGLFAQYSHGERKDYTKKFMTEYKRYVRVPSSGNKDKLAEILKEGLTSEKYKPRKLGDYHKSLQYALVEVADKIGLGKEVPNTIRAKYTEAHAALQQVEAKKHRHR